ncbi:hypothetical protein OBCHQ24_12285 [Oceanobacillus iheyensis]|nr:hypothetical protein OBCHQ24_12285 [Oceanobacillus iheyensis]
MFRVPYCDTFINVHKTKGWFTINSGISMNYTPEMEKGMQQAHKVPYAEYERKLETRLEVEKSRQKEYEKSKALINNLDKM